MKYINSYDIDGVIFISPKIGGVNPGQHDVVITGRSFEERPETERMLQVRGIYNTLYMNPLKFKDKTRESSGKHKANVINALHTLGTTIMVHFEDDEIQAEVIRKECPQTTVVMLVHDLTTKENVRHE